VGPTQKGRRHGGQHRLAIWVAGHMVVVPFDDDAEYACAWGLIGQQNPTSCTHCGKK